MNAVARDLLTSICAAGGRVSVEEGRLKVAAAAPLPPDMIAGLRAAKGAVLALLAMPEAGDDEAPMVACPICGCRHFWRTSLTREAWRCCRCVTPPWAVFTDGCSVAPTVGHGRHGGHIDAAPASPYV